MNKTISIKLKALFLLIVFALNTIVGFACATGVDMGFNHKHHHEETVGSYHHEETVGSHHHEETVGSHHHDEKDDADKDGGCCNGPVIKLQQLDKNINHAKININAPLLLALHALLGNDIFNTTPLISKYIIPLYYPPPPDIRIAIQSFQI